MGRPKGHDAQALTTTKKQLLVALATKETVKGGMKHALMTGKMSLKTPISRNATADMIVAPNTGIKPGMIRVEIKVTEIEIDLTMKRERV